MSVRMHVLTAALIWSLVGFFLMMNGYLLMEIAGKTWLALPALLLGTAKSLLLMDRIVRRNNRRLMQMQDGACLGAVYSPKTWGLVVVMIVMGRILRSSVLPGELVGIVYLAVGWALFLSSRSIWQQYFAMH